MKSMLSKCSPFLHSALNVIFLRFFAVCVLFMLARIVFYVFNIDAFPAATVATFVHGIRFDISIILYINSLYFVTMLIPCAFISSKWYRRSADIYFVSVNSIAILLNLIDTCYYPFSMRRMTFDIFQFVGATNNISDLLPIFLKDYYYMLFILLGFIALLMLTVFLTNKINYRQSVGKMRKLIIQIVVRLGFAFLIFTGMRGGGNTAPLI